MGKILQTHRTASAVLLLAVLCGGCAAPAWFTTGGGGTATPKSLVTTFAGDAHSTRAFTWYTDETGQGTVLQIAKGTEAGALTGSGVKTLKGTSEEVKTSKGVKQEAHHVELTGLEAGTSYVYRVGSSAKGPWSDAAVFQTEAAQTDEVTFLNLTDSQGETEADFQVWSSTLNQALSRFPGAGFVVHNGDLTEDPEDEKAWDAFFGLAEGVVARIPLMPVTGNHDEVDGKASRYTSHFLLPGNGAAGSLPGTTYSFDYGPVHVAVLNTESNIEAQTEWLRKDLAAANAPWKIVAMHRGVYGGSTFDDGKDWIKVLDEFKVDLVLQGHNHEYSRSYPIRGGRIAGGSGQDLAVNHEGTFYVVTNTSGVKFNEEKNNKFYHAVHFQNNKQMYAGITVRGDTLTYQAYDTDGKLWDSFTIRH